MPSPLRRDRTFQPLVDFKHPLFCQAVAVIQHLKDQQVFLFPAADDNESLSVGWILEAVLQMCIRDRRETTLLTAENRQFRRERSSRKKCRSSLAMVKTQCRCWTSMILKDMEVDLSMEYMLPQVGQKREWHRKGTYLKVPQQGQANMAPPKEGRCV